MRKLKTHFKQVPLEIVRKIVEQQTAEEKLSVAPVADDRKELEENGFEATTVAR